MKLVRGNDNGPPVLGGPSPADRRSTGFQSEFRHRPVNTPAKEAHVLNDAILRAALDLSKRDRARRKVIMIISDGRERGSQASYRDVLRVLETHGIQVKAVVLTRGRCRFTSRSKSSITSAGRDTATFCRNTPMRPAAEIS